MSISIVERGSRIGHTKVLLKASLEVRTLVFSVNRNPLLLQVCFDLRFVHSIVLGVFASGSVPKLLDSRNLLSRCRFLETYSERSRVPGRWFRTRGALRVGTWR